MGDRLAVVVLTKDRADYVERLASGLSRAWEAFDPTDEDCPDGEVWLVNNGAPRARAKRKHYDPSTKIGVREGWRVIEPGRNTGYSEGNNLAVRHTHAEWLLLLNNDVQLRDTALVQLWRHRHAAPVLGCLILNSDGTVNHAGTSLLPWPAHMHRGRNPQVVADSAGEPCPEVDAVTFACVLVRRDVYDEVGGLDEGYWYCYEDTDFCCKAREAGHDIRVCLQAVVTHDECGTRERGGSYETEGATRFAERWPEAKRKQILGR